jgi:hypothetical protein
MTNEERLKIRLEAVIYPEHSDNCENAYYAGYGYSKAVPREKCFCSAFKRCDKIIESLMTIFKEEMKRSEEH